MISSVLMASLSQAKANFANTWEFEVVEQIVAFQSKCFSLDRNDVYSGFCRNTWFQAWTSRCVLDLVAWEDLGHCVLHFDLLFPSANEF